MSGGRIELLDGDALCPGTYVVIDAAGREQTEYGSPTESSIDDELSFHGVHHIVDGTLCSAFLVWNARLDGGRCSLISRRVELTFLDPRST